MLLGTVWSLYPNEDGNKIRFICNRKVEDGKVCGEVVNVSTSEMAKTKGSNKSELMAEGMV